MDEKVIEQIKAQVSKGEKAESSEAGSLLMQIRQKELVISGKVLETKKKAEGIVAEARKEAAVIVQQAGETGIKEAQEYYKSRMAETHAQAKKIDADTINEATKVEQRGEKRLDEAVAYVVNMVTPQSQ